MGLMVLAKGELKLSKINTLKGNPDRLAGETTPSSSTAQLALVRLTTTGHLDTAFNSNGKWITSFYNLPGYLRAVAIDSQNRILFAGGVLDSDHGRVVLGRVNTNGTLDNSFAESGIIVNDLFDESPTAPWATTLMNDNRRIIVAEATGSHLVLWGQLPKNTLTTVNQPTSPFSLRAVTLSRNEVELAWKMNENAADPEGFIIQRSTDGGAHFSPFAIVNDGSARSFDVTGLDPNTDYDFRVDAATDGGDGQLGDGSNGEFGDGDDGESGDSDDFTAPGTDTDSATTSNDQWEDLDESVTPDINSDDISYFNSGDDFPAGEYRLLYAGGAVNYDYTEDQSDPKWLAMDYYATTGPDLANDGFSGQPYPGNQEGYLHQPTLADAEHEATPTLWSFYHLGGPMGLGLYNPTPYNSGPGVTWKLQRLIPHVSVSIVGLSDYTTEGDTESPAQLHFHTDDHFNEPLTVKFDLSGSGMQGDSDQFTAVMVTADGEGGYNEEEIDLSSGEITIPGDLNDVEVDVTAVDDATREWTKDVKLDLKDDSHYIVNHISDDDGADTDGDGSDNDPDVTFYLRDNDGPTLEMLPAIFEANSDDDDHNGIPDYYDNGPLSITGDDDLKSISLTIPTDSKPDTTATLSINSGKLRVWKDANKSVLFLDGDHLTKTWPASDTPSEVYVECIDGSSEENDLDLTLSVSDAGEHPSQYDPDVQRATGVRIIIAAGENLPPETHNEIQNRTVRKLIGSYNYAVVQVTAPPEWINSLRAAWSVGSGAFKDWRADNSKGIYEDLDPLADLTTNNMAGPIFYYKTSGQKTVSVTVSISDATFTREYTIDSAAPTVTQTSLAIGTAQVWNSPTVGGWAAGLSGLTVTLNNGTTKSAGILWKNTVTLPADFQVGGANYHGKPGVWNYVQLVDQAIRYYETINGTRDVMAPILFGKALDSIYPAPSNDLPAFNAKAWTEYADQPWGRDVSGWSAGTAGTFYDEPATPLIPGQIGDGKRQDVFETYIMFNPGGFLDMWVPLKILRWHWSAYWKSQTIAGQPPFTLVSGSPAAGGYTGDALQDTSTHPTWTFNGGFDDIQFPGSLNQMRSSPDKTDPNLWNLPPIP